MSTNNEVKSPTMVTPNSMISPTTSVTIQNEPKESKENKVKLTWNDQTETLLRSWGDISSCYNWMHDKSFRKYQKKNFKFSLPVIILSTLTGTLNLALQGYVPPEYITYAQAGIGGVNIFTGILTTLQNYFRYAENSESHRNASVGWGKLQRNISIELTYDRLSRKDADSFIKVCRMEYDRLLEQSPIIPTEIISLFKKKYAEQRLQKKKQKDARKQERKFSKSNNNEEIEEDDIIQDDEDDKLILPDVCGELTHTGVYKESLNECTRLDKILDVKHSEELKLIPEIKDVLLDRLSVLEQKLGASHTPRMEFKPLHEYSSEELKLALDRKNITSNIIHRSDSITKDTETAIQKAIQKNIEPMNLHIRRLSEQLEKPNLNRINTSYMADIPIKPQTSRDFSFKDLMTRFQPNTLNPIIETKKNVLNEINKNIETVENKIVENKNIEEIKNDIIININEKLDEVSTPILPNIVKEDINITETSTNNKDIINIENKIVESVQESLNNIIENPILEQIIDQDLKPKPKKNKVEITKTNPIDKSQKKLNSFFTPVKPKEEEPIIIIQEESITREESLTSEPSTFEISINENGEESIKLNFIDTDEDDDQK